MKTYLVTGGAGFIGSNFIKYMLSKHRDVKIICLDKLTYAGNINNLKAELNDKRLYFVRGDINDIGVLKNIFGKFDVDYVVNFAAESHVDRSIYSPQIFLKTNVLGTQNLLKASKEFWEVLEGVYEKNKMFIQISTDEVYGSCRTGKFNEDSPLDPRSPYAASKASADLIVKAYIHTYNFPAIIARSSNNYGPYQFPEKIIPLMLNNIFNNKPLPVYAKGENIREWTHVLDNCEAIDLVIKKGKLGETYNIGSNCEMRNIDLVRLLISKVSKLLKSAQKYKKIIKTPEQKINHGLIRFVKDRPGHDFRYSMGNSKIMSLGWKPKISFDKGLDLTIEWYLSNLGWLKDVTTGDYQKYYKRMYKNRQAK